MHVADEKQLTAKQENPIKKYFVGLFKFPLIFSAYISSLMNLVWVKENMFEEMIFNENEIHQFCQNVFLYSICELDSTPTQSIYFLFTESSNIRNNCLWLQLGIDKAHEKKIVRGTQNGYRWEKHFFILC